MRTRACFLAWLFLALLGVAVLAGDPAAPSPTPVRLGPGGETLYPINLATALQLAGARPLDIALASERVRIAAAQRDRARVLWLPHLYTGADYHRHDGQIQDVAGIVFPTSRSAVMVGTGPTAVFAVTEALFQPLATRQVLRAREAAQQTARNDSLLAVAEAYFNVQQARGDLIAAQDVARRTTELARRTEQLAKGLVPPVEAVRVRAELARRRQVVHLALGRWRSASADLVRVLRLDAGALVEPLEPPDLKVTLLGIDRPLADLIPIAQTSRPELATHQYLVEAANARLRQERWRPFLPSVLVRGTSANPAGQLGVGYFGGGRNSFLGNFGARGDIDVQLLWELQNLGFGNRALINERRAENRAALIELERIHYEVVADVTRAHADFRAAADRLGDAELGLKDAVDSAQKNLEGLTQTRRAGEVVLLVIRPQEAVASVQALAQAYADFYSAVADYNRAQFRLYRALGQPAQILTESACIEEAPLQSAPPARTP